MEDLCRSTLHDLGDALQSKRISSVEATRACLARANKTLDLNAFIHLDEAGALAQAQASDTRRAAGKAFGQLDGAPIALKDIILSEGLPATCGSEILRDFVAPYDGTVVQRLRAAGAVIVGKNNMDEFGMGSSNEHSAFGPAKNPWDAKRVPGGSSGGSAAAVAVGSCFGALATDTGGSIRQPASFTGIVGLKPTYGRVSRYGVMAYASSLDQVGPMARNVSDCALLLQAIAGEDPRDATSAAREVPSYTTDLEAGVKGMKLGVPKEYFADGIDPQVRKAVEAALETYKQLGATLIDISLPHTAHGIATYYVLAPAEASSNLARYDGVRYGLRKDPGKGLVDMYLASRATGFGREVKRRIMLGTYVLSSGYYDAYYRRAQRVRTLVRQDFEQAFQKVDAIVTPTAPTPAFQLGENASDPIKMYLGDVFTVTANLAGLPGLSLPCGFTADKLPMGLQILGPPWEEAKILRIARAYESACEWHTRRPA